MGALGLSFPEYVEELHRAVHALGLFLDARLAGEISQPEALVIMHLSERSESTVNELHHAFLHRRSTLTGVLDRLESKGLVKRRPASSDRRTVSVALTSKGGLVAGRIAEALDQLREELERSSHTVKARDRTLLRQLAEAASVQADLEHARIR